MFRLYVAGQSARSKETIREVSALCDSAFDENYNLQIVDIFEEPELAIEQGIIATPTFQKLSPDPKRKIVGPLANRSDVLRMLDMDLFDLQILGFPGLSIADAARGLVRVFGERPDFAEAYVKLSPVLFRRHLDPSAAQYFTLLLLVLGADVRVIAYPSGDRWICRANEGHVPGPTEVESALGALDETSEFTRVGPLPEDVLTSEWHSVRRRTGDRSAASMARLSGNEQTQVFRFMLGEDTDIGDRLKGLLPKLPAIRIPSVGLERIDEAIRTVSKDFTRIVGQGREGLKKRRRGLAVLLLALFMSLAVLFVSSRSRQTLEIETDAGAIGVSIPDTFGRVSSQSSVADVGFGRALYSIRTASDGGYRSGVYTLVHLQLVGDNRNESDLLVSSVDTIVNLQAHGRVVEARERRYHTASGMEFQFVPRGENDQATGLGRAFRRSSEIVIMLCPKPSGNDSGECTRFFESFDYAAWRS